jgi:hypothetical protein
MLVVCVNPDHEHLTESRVTHRDVVVLAWGQVYPASILLG